MKSPGIPSLIGEQKRILEPSLDETILVKGGAGCFWGQGGVTSSAKVYIQGETMGILMKSESDWFALCETETGDFNLSFKTAPIDFELEILVRQPLPELRLCEGRVVALTGKAPMWIYAHAAAWAVCGQCREVRVSQPNLPDQLDSVRVYPLEPAPTGFDWMEITANGKITQLEFKGPSKEQGTWPLAILSDVPGQLMPVEKTKPLVLTGKGSAWMYSAVSATACTMGFDTIVYASVKEKKDVTYLLWPELKRLQFNLPHRSTPGLRIGIVGDPNSGKSVFSMMLDRACRAEKIEVWRYDCDAASGTPDWYIDLMKSQRSKEGVALREHVKRKWNHDLETQVAECLKHLKFKLQLVIADLPGGKHEKAKPPEEGVRIPPGREVIMKEIDAFIIINIGSRNSAYHWMEALKVHGLEDRVMGVITSLAPDAPPSLVLDEKSTAGFFSGFATGLDRSGDFNAGADALIPIARMIQTRLIETQGDKKDEAETSPVQPKAELFCQRGK